jgi:uroporphyrinogen decarboxylase
VGQVKAGAQMLQVFESNAECLTADLFMTFCLPYLKEIAAGVRMALERDNVDSVPMVMSAA